MGHFAFILLFSLIINLVFYVFFFFNTVLELSFYLDQLSNLSRSPKKNAAQTTQHCSASKSRADPEPALLPSQPTGLPCPFGWTKHLVLASLFLQPLSPSQSHTLQLLCEILLPSSPSALSDSAQPLFPGQLKPFPHPARACFFCSARVTQLQPSIQRPTQIILPGQAGTQLTLGSQLEHPACPASHSSFLQLGSQPEPCFAQHRIAMGNQAQALLKCVQTTLSYLLQWFISFSREANQIGQASFNLNESILTILAHLVFTHFARTELQRRCFIIFPSTEAKLTCKSPDCPSSISFWRSNLYHSLECVLTPPLGWGSFLSWDPSSVLHCCLLHAPQDLNLPPCCGPCSHGFHYTPRQRTLRNVVSPHLPITNLWYLCCTGPSAQQLALLQLSCTLHCCSLLWSCWAIISQSLCNISPSVFLHHYFHPVFLRTLCL